MTDEEIARAIAAINTAVVAIGLTPDDRAATLLACASEAAVKAWGARKAAAEVYVLSLMLAKRAGLTAPPQPPKSTATH